MGADEANENETGVVVDFDDEPVVVALDVKDEAVARKDVGGGIGLLDRGGSSPGRHTGFMKPRPQRLLGIGMSRPEVAQGASADDSHEESGVMRGRKRA